MAKRKILTGGDIALIAGIAVCTLGGFAFAAFSGVVLIPGIEPILQADVPVASLSPSPSPSSVAVPSPSSSTAVAEPVPTVSPSPSPSQSPSPAPSPTPSAQSIEVTNKTRDDTAKRDLGTYQAALKSYYDKHKSYPLAASYSEGRTDRSNTPLTVLVSEGYMKSLIKPDDAPDYWYGYRSADGKSYELTAKLRDTSDPSGAYDAQQNYLYTIPSQ